MSFSLESASNRRFTSSTKCGLVLTKGRVRNCPYPDRSIGPRRPLCGTPISRNSWRTDFLPAAPFHNAAGGIRGSLSGGSVRKPFSLIAGTSPQWGPSMRCSRSIINWHNSVRGAQNCYNPRDVCWLQRRRSSGKFICWPRWRPVCANLGSFLASTRLGRMVSIIVPVINEEHGLDALHTRLVAALEPLGCDWEILFIDDGSTDSTLAKLRDLQSHGCAGSRHLFQPQLWQGKSHCGRTAVCNRRCSHHHGR